MKLFSCKTGFLLLLDKLSCLSGNSEKASALNGKNLMEWKTEQVFNISKEIYTKLFTYCMSLYAHSLYG